MGCFFNNGGQSGLGKMGKGRRYSYYSDANWRRREKEREMFKKKMYKKGNWKDITNKVCPCSM